MSEDTSEIQRRYPRVRDLHERAKEAVLYGADPLHGVAVSKDEALKIAAEYFQAAEKLENYGRECRQRHIDALSRLGVEMELDGTTSTAEDDA
jgi:hypothetical protein